MGEDAPMEKRRKIIPVPALAILGKVLFKENEHEK